MFEKEAEEYISNLDECRTKDLMREMNKKSPCFSWGMNCFFS